MKERPIDWYDAAYFDAPIPDTTDGANTNKGLLWHAAPPRWGHSMHTMCSYHGMFPAKLVHYFLQRYSRQGDLVVDPFSGRGTTTLQARVEGRRSAGNDLNPLAHVLTSAKAAPPTWAKMESFVDNLERSYRRAPQAEPDVSDDIRMLFHKNTLRQLVYMRSRLLKKGMASWSPEEFMLAGAVAGILHGAHRSDGSSAYLSISMPNTFSMSPEYVRKFIRENRLVRIDQNVFECLRDKLARLYLDSNDGAEATVEKLDAAKLLSGRHLRRDSVNLVLTSPPYLRVVNYGTSNWIRLWWLGLDDVARQQGAGRKALDAELDHRHTYDSYCEFILRILTGVRRVLRQDGVAVFVIGDVASPSGSSIELAERVWADLSGRTDLQLVDLIEDELPTRSKVSRIWGETKGRATERDCVLVLGRKDGEPTVYPDEIDWDESYRDAGPDAAHARLRERRTAS
jgi:hypothetical protein